MLIFPHKPYIEPRKCIKHVANANVIDKNSVQTTFLLAGNAAKVRAAVRAQPDFGGGAVGTNKRARPLARQEQVQVCWSLTPCALIREHDFLFALRRRSPVYKPAWCSLRLYELWLQGMLFSLQYKFSVSTKCFKV